MSLRITSREDEPAIVVEDATHLDQALDAASQEARTANKLNGLVIEADNGNRLLFVVGGEETALLFNYGGEDPPYYASKGAREDEHAWMTFYTNFQHHTEFPRRFVIPFADGVKAVHQFFDTDELPTCINWEES